MPSADAAPASAPAPSAILKLIAANKAQSRTPAEHAASLHQALALQVQHNLQYQHQWTALRFHTHSPLPPYAALPRPMISGLPPRRLYVHPDEQIELLKEARRRNKDKGKAATATAAVAAPPPPETGASQPPKKGIKTLREEAEKLDPASRLDIQADPEREWVLPTRLSEPWSIEKTAQVMDVINLVPAASEAEDHAEAVTTKWRTEKRVLMAIVDNDSTVVYYIVHDGIVKPRQN